VLTRAGVRITPVLGTWVIVITSNESKLAGTIAAHIGSALVFIITDCGSTSGLRLAWLFWTYLRRRNKLTPWFLEAAGFWSTRQVVFADELIVNASSEWIDYECAIFRWTENPLIAGFQNTVSTGLSRLDLAVSRTTIIFVGIAIITFFPDQPVHDTVTALFSTVTVCWAAVSVNVIAVVAHLRTIIDAVSAQLWNIYFAGRCTAIQFFFGVAIIALFSEFVVSNSVTTILVWQAIGRTPIPIHLVSIVAAFTTDRPMIPTAIIVVVAIVQAIHHHDVLATTFLCDTGIDSTGISVVAWNRVIFTFTGFVIAWFGGTWVIIKTDWIFFNPCWIFFHHRRIGHVIAAEWIGRVNTLAWRWLARINRAGDVIVAVIVVVGTFASHSAPNCIGIAVPVGAPVPNDLITALSDFLDNCIGLAKSSFSIIGCHCLSVDFRTFHQTIVVRRTFLASCVIKCVQTSGLGVTWISCATVIIVTIRRLGWAGTGILNVTGFRGTWISIITDIITDAFSPVYGCIDTAGKNVAGIIGTDVVVIANQRFVGAFTFTGVDGVRSTRILCAGVVVIALVGCVDAGPGGGVAGIRDGARIIVIAILWFLVALALQAPIVCTIFGIQRDALHGWIFTADTRVAEISSAEVPVITIVGIDVQALTFLANIVGAFVTVIADNQCMCAVTTERVTEVVGAEVVIRTVHEVVGTLSWFTVAFIVCTAVPIITDFCRVDAAKPVGILGVTGIVSAQITIIAVPGGVHALVSSPIRNTDILSAGIIVSTSDSGVDTISGDAIATIGSAWVLIIADNVFVGTRSIIRVTEVDSAWIQVRATWSIDAFSGQAVATIDCANVIVITVDFLIQAFSVFGVTTVHGAKVFQGFGRIHVVCAIHRNIDTGSTIFLVAGIHCTGIAIIAILVGVLAQLRVTFNTVIIGTLKAVIAMNLILAITCCRVATVSRTGVAIFTVDLQVFTPVAWVAAIIRTSVIVVAIDVEVQTFTALPIADIFGAGIVVITVSIDIGATGLRIALIDCTGIIILATYRRIVASCLSRICRIIDTGVQRTLITVVALQRRERAESGFRIAVVLGAEVLIRTFLGQIDATTVDGIAAIGGAQVVIVAIHLDIGTATGHLVAGVDGTKVIIGTFQRREAALSGFRAADILGTTVAVIADHRREFTFTWVFVTGIGCTLVAVVADLQYISAFSSVLVAVINRTGYAVITCQHVQTFTCLSIAGIDRAVVLVITILLSIRAHTGLRIARILGARLVVIAGLGLVDATDNFVAGIDCTLVVIAAVHRSWRQAFSAFLLDADFFGAGVSVVALLVVGAFSVVLVTRVNGTIQEVVAFQSPVATWIRIATIIRTGVAILAGLQFIDTFTRDGVAAILGTEVAVVTVFHFVDAAHITITIVSAASVAVIAHIHIFPVIPLTIAGLGVARILSAEDTIIALHLFVDAGSGILAAIVSGTGQAVSASYSDVVTDSCGRVALVFGAVDVISTICNGVLASQFLVAGVIGAVILITAIQGFRIQALAGCGITQIDGASVAVIASRGSKLAFPICRVAGICSTWNTVIAILWSIRARTVRRSAGV
jgi:hypothetical protein